MKKFLKFLAGVAAIAGIVCGVLYFAKNVLGLGEDYEDEFDDDFDDFEDESAEDDYVTLDLDEEPEDTKVTDDEAEAEEE